MRRIPHLSSEPTPAMAEGWAAYCRLAVEYEADPADRDDIAAEMVAIGKRIAGRASATLGDVAIKLRLAEHHSTHGEGYEDGEARPLLDSVMRDLTALFPDIQPPTLPAREADSAALAELRSHALRLGAGWMAAKFRRHGVKRLDDIPAGSVASEVQRAALA